MPAAPATTACSAPPWAAETLTETLLSNDLTARSLAIYEPRRRKRLGSELPRDGGFVRLLPSRVGRDAALFLLTALPRLLYLLTSRLPFDGPYWLLSESLLRDGSLTLGGIKTTDFEPVYPFFLAVSRFIARDHILVVQMFQVAVSSTGAILLHRLVRILTGRSEVAVISAFLYAVDPLLIKQAVGESPFVIVTTLLIAFAYAFVATTTTVGAAGVGVALGMCVLTRTMTLPLVGCSAVLLLADRRPRAAIAATLTALLVIVPLPLRNHAVNGSWWPTRSGLNLFIANSPYTSMLVPHDDADVLERFADDVIAREMGHVSADSPEFQREADAILRRHALIYMSEQDPLRTLRDKAWNVFHYFWPPLVPYYVKGPQMRVVVTPTGDIAVENHVRRPLIEIIGYSASYSFVLTSAIVGIFLRRRALRRDAVLWCVMMTFVAVHTLYFPATRYRAPVSFVLIVYASVALERLGRRAGWKPS